MVLYRAYDYRGINFMQRTQRIFLLGLGVILISLGCLSGCATNGKIPTAVKFRGMSARVILEKGEMALARRQYKAAIKYFEALDTLYPFGRYTRQTQLNIIYAYYGKGDKAEAIAAADRYIKLYPRGPHTDYAYYMKGIASLSQQSTFVRRMFGIDPAQRQLKGLKTAFNAFGRLVRYFSYSHYAPDARRKMIYIRNLLAQHELEVADFYYRRRAYVGAANRAARVVRFYQGAPQVVSALGLMVKSYRAIGEYRLANDALRVLLTNYADSPEARALRASR